MSKQLNRAVRDAWVGKHEKSLREEYWEYVSNPSRDNDPKGVMSFEQWCAQEWSIATSQMMALLANGVEWPKR